MLGFIEWEEYSIAGDTCRRRVEPREGHESAIIGLTVGRLATVRAAQGVRYEPIGRAAVGRGLLTDGLELAADICSPIVSPSRNDFALL